MKSKNDNKGEKKMRIVFEILTFFVNTKMTQQILGASVFHDTYHIDVHRRHQIVMKD
jgi:hypothetical protein